MTPRGSGSPAGNRPSRAGHGGFSRGRASRLEGLAAITVLDTGMFCSSRDDLQPFRGQRNSLSYCLEEQSPVSLAVVTTLAVLDPSRFGLASQEAGPGQSSTAAHSRT